MKTKAQEEIKFVEANPEKNFFVNMLTRDIELHDAILDLLDNCVDGALRTLAEKKKTPKSLKGFCAKIHFDKSKFQIEDNCGGISWEIAREYAFKMGKPLSSQRPEGTIGVVGIGMKRAIFKMGRRCYVHSNHSEDQFMVSIEPEWFDSNKWENFPAERCKPTGSEFGTIVEIDHLNIEVAAAFDEGSSFRTRFPGIVAEAYSYLIEKGFDIYVNGKKVPGRPIELCFEDKIKKNGDEIRPFVWKGVIDGVEVFMAIGYRSSLKTSDELETESDESYAAADAGWTVLCNDRVVLSNDRSVKTGWEYNGVPRFHNQFSCIAGIVEFRSKDTQKLPITTTKRGIDAGREVYIQTVMKMQEATKHFTKNTNRWKGSEQELKTRFAAAKKYGLAELKEKITEVGLSGIPGKILCSQYRPSLPVKTREDRYRRISYSKLITDIECVSSFLYDEQQSPEIVGEACFDRVLKEAKRK